MKATEVTFEKTHTNTALDSVRRLEETLDDMQEAREAARVRIVAAREEAERIVREARDEAELEATGRRHLALARADGETARVLEEARARADKLGALAEEDRAAAAREVVSWLLPGRGA